MKTREKMLQILLVAGLILGCCACSFGLIGALVNFHPFVLSVWGSDVYSYPQMGRFYEKLLRFTLRKADEVRALFLLRKLSAAPPIAPERPASEPS